MSDSSGNMSTSTSSTSKLFSYYAMANNNQNRWVLELQVMASNDKISLEMIEMYIEDGHQGLIPFGPIRLHIVNYFDNETCTFTFKSCKKYLESDICRAQIEGNFLYEYKSEENDLISDLYRVFVMAIDKTMEKPIMLILHEMAKSLTRFEAWEFAQLLLESQIEAWRLIML